MNAASPEGRVLDLLGIGIGPFNLGLACLTEPLGLDAVFLDARDGFAWHHGLMLSDATIQVPFLADLVTLADPTSPYSFLTYLKQRGRLYQFYIREDFQPLRVEYDNYCRWAADHVTGLRWGREVIDVRREPSGADLVYRVTARTADGSETYRTRHLVLGIGTSPYSPVSTEALDGDGTVALHASDYLNRREDLLGLGSVTVVGSGQSAAEVFHDLLSATGADGPRVDWVTRSPRFFPMEYTKLTLEMTSPEYIDHFHALPPTVRDDLLSAQRSLYKGIDADLINRIHELLYRRSVHGLSCGTLTAATALDGARRQSLRPRAAAANPHPSLLLDLRCTDSGQPWQHSCEGVVLATGYRPATAAFLDGIATDIDRDERGRYRVSRNHTIDHAHQYIHVQNAEEHTHGLTAPDLGMGAMRNSVILRDICGREVYPIERSIAFQRFGAAAPPQTQEVR